MARLPEQARVYWSRNYTAMSSVEVNLDIVGTLGLELVEHFALGRNAFWQEYYQPMEERIAELRVGPAGDEPLFKALEREIEVYRRWGDSYAYVFYVIRVPM